MGQRGASQSDLAYLEGTTVPRPEELVNRFAGSGMPWWGVVLYAILFGYVALALAGGVGLLPVLVLALTDTVDVKQAGWTTPAALAIMGVVFAFECRWFVRWIKRRRGAIRTLIRDGSLVEGTVVDPRTWRPGQVAHHAANATVGYLGRGKVRIVHVALEHDGKHRLVSVPLANMSLPPPGTRAPVLFHPACKHAVMFDHTGTLRVGTVRKAS